MPAPPWSRCHLEEGHPLPGEEDQIRPSPTPQKTSPRYFCHVSSQLAHTRNHNHNQGHFPHGSSYPKTLFSRLGQSVGDVWKHLFNI